MATAHPLDPPGLPEAPAPAGAGLRLARIQVRNFRNIADVDVTIPEGKQILCLVGPNGSSKSALMSLMVRALRQLMNESTPDEPSPPPRLLSGAEIGPEGDASGVRLDWAWATKTLTHHTVVGGNKESGFLANLRAELEVPSQSAWSWDLRLSKRHHESPGFLASWSNSAPHDPLSTSIFLERPVGRFETPFYEEPRDLTVGLRPQPRISGHRPLPIRAATGLERLEAFLLDLVVDQVVAATRLVNSALSKVNKAYAQMHQDTTRPLLNVGPWPFRRIQVAGLQAPSLLSAGELDVLVTVGEIVAQQLYLQRTLGAQVGEEPPGVVFIDEVDAHLHPQWQQKILPLYAELFPTIQFVVTTHSPFVLRSLPKDKSFVLRLPDGHVFDEDFGAWSIEDILETVFTVPGRWSEEIKGKLLDLERSASAPEQTPEQEERTTLLYLDLAHRSPTLRSACDRILALYAEPRLRDHIRGREQT